MKKALLPFILIAFFSCKKEEKKTETLQISSPIVQSNGWQLEKYSPEFYTLSAGVRTLDLVKEHSNGIDILYSSIFHLQDLQSINVRWRAYHSKDHDVKKVFVTDYSLDYANRPVPSKLLDAYSKGLGEYDLLAVSELGTEPGASRFIYEYNYFNVLSLRNSIFRFKPNEYIIDRSGGIGSADPKVAFANNNILTQQFNNPIPIYAVGNVCLGAASKGKELVMFGKGVGNELSVYESTNKQISQVISAKNEIVRPVVIKNVFDLSKLTKTDIQNSIVASKFFSDENFLYVFLGLKNKKHRFIKINLSNYTLSSINESLYEKIDLEGYKNLILLNDRPGEMLSMEKDGIYHLAGNTKTIIASAQIKVGSTGTTVYYSNGKIWQVLFDENGSYLISKSL